MQVLRQAKVAGIAKDIPPLEVFGPGERRPADPRLGLDLRRDPLARSSGCRPRAESVAHAHLRHLNPFPANTEDVAARATARVLIPEVNLGQLLLLIRAQLPDRRRRLDQVRGKPFRIAEIVEEAERIARRVAGERPATTVGLTETARTATATAASRPLSPENAQVIALTRKDFVSDQEVRWCPGCGDYSILAQTQKVMPDFGYPKENIVFISRHRLLQPVAVLHEHVRLPHHPRPGPDARHRASRRPART